MPLPMEVSTPIWMDWSESKMVFVCTGTLLDKPNINIWLDIRVKFIQFVRKIGFKIWNEIESQSNPKQ